MELLEALSKFQSIFVWGMGSLIFIFLTVLATKFTTKDEHKKLRGEHDALVKIVDKLEIEFVIVRKGHETLQAEFSKVAKVTTILQTRVDTLPTDDTISELKEGMVRLEGRIENALEKFEKTDALILRLERQVDRMDQFLVRSAT